MAPDAQGQKLGLDEELVALAVRRIVAAFGPLRVILFGSRARGTAGPTSDVDLLVVCPK